jgi:hypothetical protein
MSSTTVGDAVRALDQELRGVFGSRLQSLVVYGQRARHPHGGGHSHREPPAHTLVVVDGLTAADLRACATRVEAWHDQGLATPLVLAAHEFGRALDAFPFEFGDILADHMVVSGSSPFDGLTVDSSALRHACEVQARGHLLHLREGFLETRGRADALAVLIVRSAPPFAALLSAVARLEGHAIADPAAAARHAERVLKLPGTIAGEIVALTHVHEISSSDAERLFPPYLKAVEKLVEYVDRWRAQ